MRPYNVKQPQLCSNKTWVLIISFKNNLRVHEYVPFLSSLVPLAYWISPFLRKKKRISTSPTTITYPQPSAQQLYQQIFKFSLIFPFDFDSVFWIDNTFLYLPIKSLIFYSNILRSSLLPIPLQIFNFLSSSSSIHIVSCFLRNIYFSFKIDFYLFLSY